MFVLQKDAYLTPETAVALLGGEPARGAVWRDCIRRACFVAAADGGASMALAENRCPDLLAGDFDSLAAEELAVCRAAAADGICEICELPAAKDQTDGEFLLRRLQQDGWRRLLILGALGGRLEQTLANLLTAAPLAEAGLEICLAPAGLEDGVLFLLGAAPEAGPAQLSLQGFAGCTVSLVALGGKCARVELSGFAYPLRGELAAFTSLGISNVAQQADCRVSLRDGALLIIINRS